MCLPISDETRSCSRRRHSKATSRFNCSTTIRHAASRHRSTVVAVTVADDVDVLTPRSAWPSIQKA
eukprot:384471-Pleurochrysis_carterae.AAC.1